MVDVKWIKIVTNIFDDPKIKQIDHDKKGDAILLIWFKILCLAGKLNKGGTLVMGDGKPYDAQMLSIEFNRKQSIIETALRVFVEYGIIEMDGATVVITNWKKHQNLDKIERENEYQRSYMRRYREQKKSLTDDGCKPNSKPNGNTTVSPIELYKEDKEYKQELDGKEIVKETGLVSPSAPVKVPKLKYGSFSNVRLTEAEYDKLHTDYKNGDELIEFMSEYIEMKGYKANSHYLAIRKWVVDAVKERALKASNGVRPQETLEEEIERRVAAAEAYVNGGMKK